MPDFESPGMRIKYNKVYKCKQEIIRQKLFPITILWFFSKFGAVK